MSDEPFLPPMPALMSPVKARNIARAHEGIARLYDEAGDRGGARRERERSQWWLTYSLALSQIPPGAIDEGALP